jgi:hypothetical protein
MPRRIVLRRSRQVSELKLRRRPPAGLSGQARQPREHQRRRRISGGHGAVVGLLGPGDELLPLFGIG